MVAISVQTWSDCATTPCPPACRAPQNRGRSRCLEHALVDLWQADSEGVYDNAGFRLRDHQFTDATGRYRFLTIMPASYEGRTRHLHVKVQAPGGRVLTTQLYFPGEAHNRSDRLFRRELLMNVTKTEGSLAARFDFVLDVP